MKFAFALSLLLSSTSAFVPAGNERKLTTTSLSAASLNGWEPDENAFAYGLPGSVSPIKDFDPFGYTDEADLAQIKSYRESEVTHGRVAMLAMVGLLVTEAPFKFHPFFNVGDKDIGPAIRHLDEVRAAAPAFFEILALTIGAAELYRALRGWENPTEAGDKGQALKDTYYPGDIGFDPLGLKPSNPDEFANMATKELQNGRKCCHVIEKVHSN